ncbi:MAG: hypothetical protein CR217_00725 [Beijerinckiaceae bacterium]|nr:MAG: hypothetical protein CR217_00725 [Beijerinckiaceae bacterium]
MFRVRFTLIGRAPFSEFWDEELWLKIQSLLYQTKYFVVETTFSLGFGRLVLPLLRHEAV